MNCSLTFLEDLLNLPDLLRHTPPLISDDQFLRTMKMASCKRNIWALYQVSNNEPWLGNGVYHFGDRLQVLETELAKDLPRKKRWWLDTGPP